MNHITTWIVLIIAFALTGCEGTVTTTGPSGRRTVRHYGTRYTPPAEQPAPQRDEATYDATNAVWDANDRAYEETKRKAAAGDPEAQRWMQQYGAIYEMTRNWSRSKNEEWNRPRN